MTNVDPANVLPGQHPPVVDTKDDLLVEALRSASRVSLLLNEISAALGEEPPNVEKCLDLLLRRFSDCSGLHLFIAAHNLDIELPDDLSGDPADDEVDDPGYPLVLKQKIVEKYE